MFSVAGDTFEERQELRDLLAEHVSEILERLLGFASQWLKSWLIVCGG